MPAHGFHYIAQDLEPQPTDWPLFTRWLEAWDTSSRPVGSNKSGLALARTVNPGTSRTTPTGRVTP